VHTATKHREAKKPEGLACYGEKAATAVYAPAAGWRIMAVVGVGPRRD
jgi:hypothetical protein